jgi:hypothetical protein
MESLHVSLSLSLNCSQVHASANKAKFHHIGWHGHRAEQTKKKKKKKGKGKRTRKGTIESKSQLCCWYSRGTERESKRARTGKDSFDLTLLTVAAALLSPRMQALHKPGYFFGEFRIVRLSISTHPAHPTSIPTA